MCWQAKKVMNELAVMSCQIDSLWQLAGRLRQLSAGWRELEGVQQPELRLLHGW